jgi:hypothetical protein
MFKENAEPIMWWRIEGRHYIEFDDGRISTSGDGIIWKGRNNIANKNLTEGAEEEERSKLVVLYNVLVDDKHKYKKLIEDIDTVSARIRKDLGIEVYEEEKNG